ncbi:hypothetical protein WMF27_22935 [Sorangium sp. So ce281]|uniref:hypothetical protein n=1 Tax=unclassified Sorangium TaxID=2621164 RepID=UPI003F610482
MGTLKWSAGGIWCFTLARVVTARGRFGLNIFDYLPRKSINHSMTGRGWPFLMRPDSLTQPASAPRHQSHVVSCRDGKETTHNAGIIDDDDEISVACGDTTIQVATRADHTLRTGSTDEQHS